MDLSEGKPHPVFSTYIGFNDGRVYRTTSKKFITGNMVQGRRRLHLPLQNGKIRTMDVSLFLQECLSTRPQVPSDAKQHNVYKTYAATRCGHVYNLHTRKELKGGLSQGYLSCRLVHEGRAFKKFIHVLVFECFNPNVNTQGMDVDHIDGGRMNNALTNLQLLSRTEHVAKTRATVQFKSRTLEADVLDGEVWASPYDKHLRGIQVSSLGRVKNFLGITRGCLTGPYRVCKVKRKAYKVHRLVATVFLGRPPTDKHTVGHINQNPDDNHVNNLRWATMLEQAGNRRNTRAVEARTIDGKLVGRWGTISEAARITKTCYKSIKSVTTGKAKLANNFVWTLTNN